MNSYACSILRSRWAYRCKESILVGIVVAGAFGFHSIEASEAPIGTGVQVPPDLIALEFTTPDQEVFTLGIIPGGLAYINNTETGVEYALTAAPLPAGTATNLSSPDGISPSSGKSVRNSRLTYNLKIFEMIPLADGTSLKEIASVPVRPGDELSEPISGLIFRFLTVSQHHNDSSDKTHQTLLRAGCCIDCGSYMSCSAMVGACGQVCNRDAFVDLFDLDMSFQEESTHYRSAN